MIWIPWVLTVILALLAGYLLFQNISYRVALNTTKKIILQYIDPSVIESIPLDEKERMYAEELDGIMGLPKGYSRRKLLENKLFSQH